MSKTTIQICLVAIAYGSIVYIILPYAVLEGNLFFMAIVLVSLFTALGLGVLILSMSFFTIIEQVS